jgi:hypothetical protein
MKNINTSYLLIAVSMLLLLACNKDEDNTVNVKNILTRGGWYTESFDLSVSMYSGIFEFGLIACQEDDTTLFYQDGKFKQFPGEIICDNFENTVIVGSWQISDQGKSLILKFDDFDGLNSNLKFDIKEITKKVVHLTIDYSTKVNENEYSVKGEIIFYKN